MSEAGDGEEWQVVAVRLQAARNRLKLSLAECSSQLGIPASTLASYTSGKVPLPVQTGLQFCRQFIVGEAWLAGVDPDDDVRSWRGPDAYEARGDTLHFRGFTGLISHPLALSIPRSMPYRDAFNEVLAKAYKDSVTKSGGLPVLPLSEYPEPDLLRKYLSALVEVFVASIESESIVAQSKDSWGPQRTLATRLMEVWPLLRAGLAERWPALVACPDWVRRCIVPRLDSVPALILPGLGSECSSGVDNRGGSDDAVPKEWGAIARKIRERFVAERGAQSRLARDLGVSRQAVSQWLSGKAPPSGETMIRLSAWLRRNP